MISYLTFRGRCISLSSFVAALIKSSNRIFPRATNSNHELSWQLNIDVRLEDRDLKKVTYGRVNLTIVFIIRPLIMYAGLIYKYVSIRAVVSKGWPRLSLQFIFLPQLPRASKNALNNAILLRPHSIIEYQFSIRIVSTLCILRTFANMLLKD